MFENPELKELGKICEERGITVHELLKEKVSPFQDKISKSQGELIGAITRGYERSNYEWRGLVPLGEHLYIGIITPETRFPLKGDQIGDFLLGIKNPHSLELNSIWERDFKKGSDCFIGFDEWFCNHWGLLYFMDRSPQIQNPNMAFPTEEKRLELYIGDQEVLPFLQTRLEGWRYLQLSGLLQREIPVTDEITGKINEEQVKLFGTVNETERRFHDLVRERDSRIALAKASDGAIHHGSHIEAMDEFVETLRFNPQIGESRDRLLGLLRIAIKRGYHEDCIELGLEEYFFQKKEEFKL